MSNAQQIDARELISRTKARSPEFFLTYAEVAKLENKSEIEATSLPLFARLDEAEKAAIYTLIRRSQGDLPQDVPHRKMLARRLFFMLAVNRKVYRMARARHRERTAQSFAKFWNVRCRDVARCTTRLDLLRLVGSFLKGQEADFLMNRQEEVRIANAKPLTKLLDLYTCSGELEFNEVKSRKVGKLGLQRGEFWELGRDGGGQHELRFRITSTLPRAAVSIVQSLGPVTRNGGHIHMNCKGDTAIGERVFHALRYHLKWFQWLCPMVRRNNRFCHVENVSLKFADAMNDNKYAAIAANTWDRTGTVEVRVWPASADAGDWTGRAAFMKGIAKWSERTPEYFTDASLGEQGLYAIGAVSDNTNLNEQENFLELVEWMTEHDSATLRWLTSEMREKAKGEPARNGRVDQEGVTRCYELMRAYEDCDLRKPIGFRRMRKPYWVESGFRDVEAPDSGTTRRSGLAANRNPRAITVNPLTSAGFVRTPEPAPTGTYQQCNFISLIERGELGEDLDELGIGRDDVTEFFQQYVDGDALLSPNGVLLAVTAWGGCSDGIIYRYMGPWMPRRGGTRRGNAAVSNISASRPLGGRVYEVCERANPGENQLLPYIEGYAEHDIISVDDAKWIVENGEWHRVGIRLGGCSSRFAKLSRAYGSPAYRNGLSVTFLLG